MSASTKPPPSFGNAETRDLVAKWLAGEPVGEQMPGNSNLRQLHRDPQRLVYVAILEQTKRKANEAKRNSSGPK